MEKAESLHRFKIHMGDPPLPDRSTAFAHPLSQQMREMRPGQWFIVDPRYMKSNKHPARYLASKVGYVTKWAKNNGDHRRWHYYKALPDDRLHIKTGDYVIVCSRDNGIVS